MAKKFPGDANIDANSQYAKGIRGRGANSEAKNGVKISKAFKGDETIDKKAPGPKGIRSSNSKHTGVKISKAFKGDEFIDTRAPGAKGIRGATHNKTGTDTQKFDTKPKETSLSGKTSNFHENGNSMGQPSQGSGWNPYDTSIAKDGKYLFGKNYSGNKNNWNKLRRDELNMFGADLAINKKYYRFGYLNLADAISTTREYLFFTRPDLHLLDSGTNDLVKELKEIKFWQEMRSKRLGILHDLCSSYSETGYRKINYLLSNQVSSSLDVPSNEAMMSESAANMYGVSLSYRGSSESSDDNFDFSLEFKDNRNLDVFYFFRAYEEYETLKHHGVIQPLKKYTEQRIIHDQFAIYKFIVDEDMETILYYCKYYGVTPKSLPRDIFSSNNFENGITYSVNFHAQFFEDMDPRILNDFNFWLHGNDKDTISYLTKYALRPTTETGAFDNTPATTAVVCKSSIDGKYKLFWR